MSLLKNAIHIKIAQRGFLQIRLIIKYIVKIKEHIDYKDTIKKNIS